MGTMIWEPCSKPWTAAIRLSAEPAADLTLAGAEGITARPDDNLVLKAARLLRDSFPERVRPDAGMRFSLAKILPTGAGLGAAAPTRPPPCAYATASGIWVSPTRNCYPVAAKLGADVPFFLFGGTYFGEGIGEVLSPAPDPYPFHVVIGTPECRVETTWAYQNLDPHRRQEWARFKALYMTYCEDWEFYQVLRNDFDAPMRRHFPEIDSLAGKMDGFGPVKTLLSGSGASVFSLFREQEKADECRKAIQADCRFSCVAEFVQ